LKAVVADTNTKMFTSCHHCNCLAKTNILDICNISMEQSLSWEVNRSSASQEIPRILLEPAGSLPHLQAPTACPISRPCEMLCDIVSF